MLHSGLTLLVDSLDDHGFLFVLLCLCDSGLVLLVQFALELLQPFPRFGHGGNTWLSWRTLQGSKGGTGFRRVCWACLSRLHMHPLDSVQLE